MRNCRGKSDRRGRQWDSACARSIPHSALRIPHSERDHDLSTSATPRDRGASRPRVVILPFPVGRHPDHRIASELGRDACYLAGLAKYGGAGGGGGGAAHRPFKVLYALAYREDPVKPSFVVDISDTFDTKMAAIRCYASQFDGAKAAGEIHPTGQDLYELIRIQSAHYGSLIRSAYGEPFFCHETLAVDDVLQLGVQSL